MAQCQLCQNSTNLISKCLNLCPDCIRNNFRQAEPFIRKAHQEARKKFNLPPSPPKNLGGKKCQICINECQIENSKIGFCGLPLGNREKASVSFYYDRLPTNCVSDWVCPGCSSSGYPEFSYKKGPEYGYKNLAVFYQTCSFDCLFCQNWHFKESNLKNKVTADELLRYVDDRTSCICFFGGDPTPQLPHAIKTSRQILERTKDRIFRICWETNGSMNQKLLRQMVKLSLESGGCIKFDLKAFSEEMNIALSGVSNKQTLENFKLAAKYIKERTDPPLVVASTLLVPGYIDIYEIKNLSKFIVNINPEIPYNLLAFYPNFMMYDLPTTSKQHAYEAKQVATEAGIKNVKIGNIHLLSNNYII